jgi:hypothetical protein
MLIDINTQKPIWQWEEMHLLCVDHGKVLPLVESPLLWPPCEMKELKRPNLFKWD